MTTTTKEDLWEVASAVAFVRLGLVPLRKVDDKVQPPTAELAAMPLEESRKARRKYRKLWRRDLARFLKMYEQTPKRRRESEWRYTGAYMKGVWKNVEDAMTCMLNQIHSVEVGEKPSWYARAYRWERVTTCDEYRKVLLEVAKELVLVDPRRNM